MLLDVQMFGKSFGGAIIGSDAMWVITADWPAIKFGQTAEVFKTAAV